MTPWRLLGLTSLLLVVALRGVAPATASVRVERVQLQEEEGRAELVVTGDGPLTYRLLTLEDPSRVMLQLPGAAISAEALPEAASGGLVRALKLHPGDGQPPRLELALTGPAEARASREGEVLRVSLRPAEAAADQPQAGTGPPESAPIRLKDYEVTRKEGETSLLLKTDGPVSHFQSFQLDGPPRLVLDLHGAEPALPQSIYTLQHPYLERIQFGPRPDGMRVVVRLKAGISHSAQPVEEGLRVTMRRTDAGKGFRRVQGVDFTVGPEPRTGRITLALDRTGAEVQVQRERDRVVMDLPRTRLPDRLEKRLVVTDFGTVVDAVDVYQKKDRVRVVASGEGAMEPTTYQLEDKLVLDVAPEPDKGQASRGIGATGKPYEGEKLSLNFQNIEVRQALQILAEFADINIVASGSVGGTLTLRLQKVPWDQALDLVLDSQGLGMVREGNVIRVAPRTELQKQREQQLKAELQKQQLVPLQTELIQVNYAKAEEMKALLESQNEGKGGMLSQRGSISVDPRTNNLLVRETPEQIRAIRDLVKKLDRPTRQVMIEARIVKIDISFERNLGIRWGGQHQTKTQHAFPHTIQASGSLSGAQTGTSALAVDLPASGVGGGGPASLGFRLGHVANNTTLDLELSAVEAEGNGKIISSPRVVTANQKEATIEQGTEIPYQQATSSGATSVSFKKATLALAVTPQITPDKRVILDVNAANDSQGQNTVAGPTINTEEVETQVLVDNGETVVIGGIYAKAEREDRTGVPILRHIPLLGWLFETQSKFSEKTELLIFLTPRILKEKGVGALGGRSGRS